MLEELIPASLAKPAPRAIAPPPPLKSLTEGTWFKLICGASFGHLPSIRNLAIAYTVAGADCIDVAADLAVIAATQAGIAIGRSLAPRPRPLLMVSLNAGIDPHFRKAEFDASRCPIDCPRPCERICPAEAINRRGVIESRCYGCGRCVPICPLGLIVTHDRTATPNTIFPALGGEDGIAAIEIHTQPGQLAEFQYLWATIAPVAERLELLAISCPDGNESIAYLRSLHATIAATYQEKGFKASSFQGENTISPTGSILPASGGDNYQLSIVNCQLNEQPLPFTLLWQTDGRPMSGDIGTGTTHAAIKLGQKVLSANLPGYVQLAGGTNHYTVPKLRELELLRSPDRHQGICGVAYGSYARVLLSPILDELEARTEHPGKLEAHPDLLAAAVAIASDLVGQLKNRG